MPGGNRVRNFGRSSARVDDRRTASTFNGHPLR